MRAGQPIASREEVLRVISAGQVWINESYMLMVCPVDEDGYYAFFYKPVGIGYSSCCWEWHEAYKSDRSDAAGYISTTECKLVVDIGAEYDQAIRMAK